MAALSVATQSVTLQSLAITQSRRHRAPCREGLRLRTTALPPVSATGLWQGTGWARTWQ